MSNVIQVKRGVFASLPTLNQGELGFCTDTKQLFIGDGATNQEALLVPNYQQQSVGEELSRVHTTTSTVMVAVANVAIYIMPSVTLLEVRARIRSLYYTTGAYVRFYIGGVYSTTASVTGTGRTFKTIYANISALSTGWKQLAIQMNTNSAAHAAEIAGWSYRLYNSGGATGTGGGLVDNTPIGTIIAHSTGVPAGYLHCNGSAVSRTTYSDLFAVIGTNYGSGDGSTTFNLPDYRGWFLRGWANGSTLDPDRASRSDRGDGTTGDYIGTKQGSQYMSHGHTYNNIGTPGSWYTAGGGSFGVGNTGLSGGNETRPSNINVIYCIKY